MPKHLKSLFRFADIQQRDARAYKNLYGRQVKKTTGNMIVKTILDAAAVYHNPCFRVYNMPFFRGTFGDNNEEGLYCLAPGTWGIDNLENAQVLAIDGTFSTHAFPTCFSKCSL